MMRVEGPSIDRSDFLWLTAQLKHWAVHTPQQPAIIFDDQPITYGQLNAGAYALSAHFRDRGLSQGDRIGYFGRNSDLFYFTLFACALSGITLVTYNWRYAVPELRYVLDDSSPRLLIHDSEFRDTVTAAIAGLPISPHVVETEGEHSLRQIVGGSDRGFEPVTPFFEQPVVQIYTSGTTGRPKGARVGHGAMSLYRSSLAQTPEWIDWQSGEYVLSALPNFHIGGIAIMLMGLSVGASVVNTANSSARNLLDLSARYPIDHLYVVPTVLRTMLDEIAKTGESAPHYKTLTYGAAPIGIMLGEALETFGCRFSQIYGMTEACTTHLLGASHHSAEDQHRLKSVGRPIAGVAVEVRRPDGAPCATDEPGEIWIRSEMLMLGYTNAPKANEAAVIDGWYRSGDGGYIDREGFLFLTDRLNDMVISGGENVYPVEVENVLKSHPAVRDAAVIGTPDPKWGDAVTAVLELYPDAEVTFATFEIHARARLAGYKIPRIIYIAPGLPRTPSGKIQRLEAKKNLGNYDRMK